MELRDIKEMEKKSAQDEDFVEVVREIHQQVQDRLKDSSIKYKEQIDKKRREV